MLPITKRHRHRIFLGLGMVVVAAIALALFGYALRTNINLYYEPKELQAFLSQGTLNGDLVRPLRLGGIVVPGSVKRGDGLALQFLLADAESEFLVHYTGILPDLFKEGNGAVVLGMVQTGEGGVYYLAASQVLAKHDENYRPPVSSAEANKIKSLNPS